jgi:hypothetical protein
MAKQILVDPQGVEDLSRNERDIWDSYQRFLNAIEPTVMSFDGMAVTAALLALATAMAGPVVTTQPATTV